MHGKPMQQAQLLHTEGCCRLHTCKVCTERAKSKAQLTVTLFNCPRACTLHSVQNPRSPTLTCERMQTARSRYTYSADAGGRGGRIRYICVAGRDAQTLTLHIIYSVSTPSPPARLTNLTSGLSAAKTNALLPHRHPGLRAYTTQQQFTRPKSSTNLYLLMQLSFNTHIEREGYFNQSAIHVFRHQRKSCKSTKQLFIDRRAVPFCIDTPSQRADTPPLR